MKKVLFLTNKLGGYIATRSLLHQICQSLDHDLRVYVTGQHTQKGHGNTQFQVINDGPVKGRYCLAMEPENMIRAKATMYALGLLPSYIQEQKPAWFMVFGDRQEEMLGSVIAYEMGVPIIHLQAGDTSGGVDDAYRSAISQLARLCFTSTQRGRRRLLSEGISDDQIFVVGDLHVDAVVAGDYANEPTIRSTYKLGDRPYALIHFHPDTSEPANAGYQFGEIEAATRKWAEENGAVRVFVYPCNDAGSDQIINGLFALQAWAETHGKGENLRIMRALPWEDYAGLLAYSRCAVGNSSSFLIEAPYLNTPCVNVGLRQVGRQRAKNVLSVMPDRDMIYSAMQHLPEGPYEPVFGDGHAGEKAFQIIKEKENHKWNKQNWGGLRSITH